MNGKVPAGFTLVEVIVAAFLVVGVVGLAFSGWRGHANQLRLRYATIQVATELREARERAKEMRIRHVITFAADSSAYTIARAGEDALQHIPLPEGVAAVVNAAVTFSPLGEVDSAHTITIQTPQPQQHHRDHRHRRHLLHRALNRGNSLRGIASYEPGVVERRRMR